MMGGSDMMGGSSFGGGSFGGGSFGSAGGGLDGLLSTIVSLAVVIGLILLVVWLVRQYAGTGAFRANTPDRGGGENALDILKKRFAYGEIDKDEYEEKIIILTGGG